MLVALLFVVLMGFAALSLDVGRFYGERRYLQNAVDSAALACARAYSQTGTVQGAWNAGDNILQKFNLKGDPTGTAISYPGAGDQVSGYLTTPTYSNNIVGDRNLTAGIKPVASPLGCRVAISADVDTFFVKLVAPGLAQIGMVTKAYATSFGGFLPTVTYKYSNGPGPGTGSTNNFINWTMAQGNDYQCTYITDAGCQVATAVNPGREHVLFGASAKATNDSSFRGYIGLDIRDFQTLDGSGNPIHDAYNGVAPTASVNTLKAFEAAWIGQSYPGPDLCVVVPANFDPCAEVAALDGSSSGIFVTNYDQFYRVGDVIMLQLYDGTVKSIPDFTIQAPNLTMPTTGTVTTTTVAYTMNTQFRASGSVVATELWYDDGTITGVPGSPGAGDPTGSNPFMTGKVAGCTGSGPYNCGVFNQNPTPPNASTYNQSWSGLVAAGAQKGIYQAWLRGNATAPYNSRQHDSLVIVTVGGQTRDFSVAPATGSVSVPSVGTQADFPIQVRTGSGSTAWNGGATSVHLTWEQCPVYVDPFTSAVSQLSCRINGSGTSGVDVNIGSGGSTEATFNVDTGSAINDTIYTGWVRGYGKDSTNDPVTHLVQVQVQVNVTAGGTTSYVDILGYAAFQISAVDSNDVSGFAVSPTVYDPNDPLLARGRKMRLVPWERP